MIEMSMREQYQIDVWKLWPHQRRRYQPFDAHGHRAHSHTASFAQDWIGENRESVDFEQHSAVTQPSRM
jgi:hypothetical protein